MEKIGIVGLGIIGSAVYELFKKSEYNIYCYDPNVDFCHLEKCKKEVSECNYIFICVPTNYEGSFGGLDMTIVEEVICTYSPKIFISCSALQPGTADRLSRKYNKRIVVQPEYFGETVSHPLVNMGQQSFLILGGESKDVDEVIDIYKTVYNANTKIRKVTKLEAEVIKLSENRAISYKVAQCQELYDVCQATGIDYNIVREAIYGDDPRFNLWWTFIYTEKRGMSSKCIPKDVYAWEAWAKECGVEPELTSALLKYNDKLINKNVKKEMWTLSLS